MFWNTVSVCTLLHRMQKAQLSKFLCTFYVLSIYLFIFSCCCWPFFAYIPFVIYEFEGLPYLYLKLSNNRNSFTVAYLMRDESCKYFFFYFENCRWDVGAKVAFWVRWTIATARKQSAEGKEWIGYVYENVSKSIFCTNKSEKWETRLWLVFLKKSRGNNVSNNRLSRSKGRIVDFDCQTLSKLTSCCLL